MTQFWQEKALEDMTEQEWESLCDGCGKCCLHKLMDEDTEEIYYTNVACSWLNSKTCSCKDYPNRFSSGEECTKLTRDDIDDFTVQKYQMKAQNLFELSRRLYDEILADGVAKECAREVLPLASTTKLYMNGSLRSWLHYCDLRTANGTQYEHKIIADQCKELIKMQFPVTYEAMYGQCT